VQILRFWVNEQQSFLDEFCRLRVKMYKVEAGIFIELVDLQPDLAIIGFYGGAYCRKVRGEPVLTEQSFFAGEVVALPLYNVHDVVGLDARAVDGVQDGSHAAFTGIVSYKLKLGVAMLIPCVYLAVVYE